MKKGTVWTIVALAGFGVAAAAMIVARRGNRPTPERVIDECLRAADELEARVRGTIKDFASAA